MNHAAQPSDASAHPTDPDAAGPPSPVPWVLLRGLARGAGHWGDFPARLSQALGVATHPVDLPGNGALHMQRSPTDIAAMTDSARARLKAAGVAPPYHLFALSLGGMVAVDWARRYPQELAGAVLVNTSLRPFSRWTERLRPGAWPTLLGLLRPGLDAHRRESAVARLTTRRIEPGPAVAAWVALQQAQPVSVGNALRQLLAASRYRAPALAPAVPLLVLASTHDALVDVACSRALASRWALPLREHPESGHDLPIDDPGWAIEAVREWLGRGTDAR